MNAESLRERATNELRDMVKRDGRPGDALPSERQLASELGYSRDVIREALHALRAEGLIVATRSLGHRVHPGTEQTRITLSAGEWATCGVATAAEARALNVECGTAVVQVHRAEAPPLMYPAVNLIIKG